MFECLFFRLQRISSDIRDRRFLNFIMNRAASNFVPLRACGGGVVRGVAPFIQNLGVSWM
jgi:hypothetical protein